MGFLVPQIQVSVKWEIIGRRTFPTSFVTEAIVQRPPYSLPLMVRFHEFLGTGGLDAYGPRAAAALEAEQDGPGAAAKHRQLERSARNVEDSSHGFG